MHHGMEHNIPCSILQSKAIVDGTFKRAVEQVRNHSIKKLMILPKGM
jgi:hypothetical protein